jgi:hypothetical protein
MRSCAVPVPRVELQYERFCYGSHTCDCRSRCGPIEYCMMSIPTGEQCVGSPVRFTLASHLGHNIDGAWWPRTAQIARELPTLVAAVAGRLGDITDIHVNWSSAVDPPKLDSYNSYSWDGRHQSVMAISGLIACANLLIISHRTSAALAVLVLRRAANLPIDPTHCSSQAFRTADSVVRAARAEVALAALHRAKERRPASDAVPASPSVDNACMPEGCRDPLFG